MKERTNESYERKLMGFLAQIAPADQTAMKQAKARWNSVAKPIGSLGILEEDIIKIAGITKDASRLSIRKSALVVMCADHGVVEEGVTQTGQEVTRIVAENFTRNRTSVTIMCQRSGTDIFPVDMGMLGETPREECIKPGVLLNRKIAEGSQNIAKGPAMTREECARAVVSGILLVGELKKQGYGIVATGEMGIGNTTPSSALAAVLTGIPAGQATGRGAGLSDEGLSKKRAVVEKAAGRFFHTHPSFSPDAGAKSILTLMAELGGFDISGMTGLFLGGAVYRIPIVIDGFISSVAAFLAAAMKEQVRDYLLASHVSLEPAGEILLERLGISAPIHGKMHLGEGSGAVAFLPLLFMGADVYEKMGTFGDIQVEAYVDYEAEGEKRS